MDLRNYWRVLARPGSENGNWEFYPNGWFSQNQDHKTTVYKENGCQFISGKISRIEVLPDGVVAIREDLNGEDEWTVYSKECVPILTLGSNVEVLNHGLLTYKTPQGETRAVTVGRPKESVSLGYQVTAVRDAPNGVFAFAQQIRGHTYWRLCRIINGILVKNDLLSGVRDVFFFDNGSYAAFGKGDVVRVYNSNGQKIFACNRQNTTFVKVGGNYFVAYNGMRYKGVYSAEDGKLVSTNDNIEYYFANGAYYVPDDGLSFDGGKGYLTKIYAADMFADSLAAFMYKDRRYVIDTAMTIEELRRLVLDELRILPEYETRYGAYLADLLTRLYYV